MHRRGRPQSPKFNIYQDHQDAPPNQDAPSWASSNSSVPDHHRAVASTPHPYRNADGSAKPSVQLRAMRQVNNEENVRRTSVTGSRTGSSYSNTSVSSSTSMTGRPYGSSSDIQTGGSYTGGPVSHGSSQYYYNNSNEDLLMYPVDASQPHFYDRENLRPAPPELMPTTPQRARLNAYPPQQGNNYSPGQPIAAVDPNALPPMVPGYPNQVPGYPNQVPGYPIQNDLMAQAPPPPMPAREPYVPYAAGNVLRVGPTPPVSPMPSGYAQQYDQYGNGPVAQAPTPPPMPTAYVQAYHEQRGNARAAGAPRPLPQTDLRVAAGCRCQAAAGGPQKSQRSQRSQRSLRSSRSSRRNLRSNPKKPAKTTVAIKLSSLRVIVNEMKKEDDDVIVIMTVPSTAVEGNEAPTSSQRRRRRKSSKKRIQKDVPE